jgi:hypothetical protein
MNFNIMDPGRDFRASQFMSLLDVSIVQGLYPVYLLFGTPALKNF